MMTPEQIQQLQDVVAKALRDPANFPLLPYVLALVILGLISFCSAYFGEKGKNRALKEDIKTLTHAVQEVTMRYTQHLEMFKANLQLRNAALAEQFTAHQQAYSLWVRMFDRVWDSDRGAANTLYQECRKWWAENCLYLAPYAREKFLPAVNSIMMHQGLRGGAFGELEKNWQKIVALGDVLVKCVELPELGEARLLGIPTDTPLPPAS
jgi:hypothetical protein